MDDHSGRRSEPTGPKHPVLSLMPEEAGAKPPSEAALTRLAQSARAGDQLARDALYRALTPNLDQMIATCARLAWAGTAHAATDCRGIGRICGRSHS